MLPEVLRLADQVSVSWRELCRLLQTATRDSALSAAFCQKQAFSWLYLRPRQQSMPSPRSLEAFSQHCFPEAHSTDLPHGGAYVNGEV